MKFEDLKDLSDLRYQQEQRVLKTLISRENALRAELEKLDSHDLTARSVEFSEATGPRSLGADIVWMKWLAKSRSALNVELARILAQKEQHLSQVRHAYGKVLVSEALSQRNRTSVEKHKRQLKLAEMIDRAALK